MKGCLSMSMPSPLSTDWNTGIPLSFILYNGRRRSCLLTLGSRIQPWFAQNKVAKTIRAQRPRTELDHVQTRTFRKHQVLQFTGSDPRECQRVGLEITLLHAAACVEKYTWRPNRPCHNSSRQHLASSHGTDYKQYHCRPSTHEKFE